MNIEYCLFTSGTCNCVNTCSYMLPKIVSNLFYFILLTVYMVKVSVMGNHTLWIYMMMTLSRPWMIMDYNFWLSSRRGTKQIHSWNSICVSCPMNLCECIIEFSIWKWITIFNEIQYYKTTKLNITLSKCKLPRRSYLQDCSHPSKLWIVLSFVVIVPIMHWKYLRKNISYELNHGQPCTVEQHHLDTGITL